MLDLSNKNVFLFARVKVHCLAQVNGHDSCPDISSKNCRKRQRPTEEDESGEDGVSVEWKKKKSEKSEILEEGAKQVSDDERKSQGKHTEEEKKKKKKKRKKKTEENADIHKPAASTKKILTSVEQPVKSTIKPTATKATTQNVSSSDSSSNIKIPPKIKPLTSLSPKGRTKDISESQEASPILQSTNHSQKQAASTAVPPNDKVGEPCTSDSEEEMELVNQPQTQQPGSGVGAQWSGRGYCRGKTRRGGPEERGRDRGVNRRHSGSFEFSNNEAKEPSYQTDSLTNTSVVLQVCLHVSESMTRK